MSHHTIPTFDHSRLYILLNLHQESLGGRYPQEDFCQNPEDTKAVDEKPIGEVIPNFPLSAIAIGAGYRQSVLQPTKE